MSFEKVFFSVYVQWWEKYSALEPKTTICVLFHLKFLLLLCYLGCDTRWEKTFDSNKYLREGCIEHFSRKYLRKPEICDYRWASKSVLEGFSFVFVNLPLTYLFLLVVHSMCFGAKYQDKHTRGYSRLSRGSGREASTEIKHQCISGLKCIISSLYWFWIDNKFLKLDSNGTPGHASLIFFLSPPIRTFAHHWWLTPHRPTLFATQASSQTPPSSFIL